MNGEAVGSVGRRTRLRSPKPFKLIMDHISTFPFKSEIDKAVVLPLFLTGRAFCPHGADKRCRFPVAQLGYQVAASRMINLRRANAAFTDRGRSRRCVCRKLKHGRNGYEVRPGWRVN